MIQQQFSVGIVLGMGHAMVNKNISIPKDITVQ